MSISDYMANKFLKESVITSDSFDFFEVSEFGVRNLGQTKPSDVISRDLNSFAFIFEDNVEVFEANSMLQAKMMAENVVATNKLDRAVLGECIGIRESNENKVIKGIFILEFNSGGE